MGYDEHLQVHGKLATLIVEGSLEVKLLTKWTVEKQR